ncbi:MAG: ABC transporter ATP-binding protein [Lentisphaeria bacterium]|nr:ABC transporter ATP-binding protein [Lentisphaeria bacterium]
MLARITKQLRHFQLDVEIAVGDGTNVAIVGPSGCGKTTVLNCVAGLVRPDDGVVTLDAHTVFDAQNGINIPPEQRNVGMVFQQYALFPHLTVFDNVAYGLLTRHMPERDVHARVDKILERVGMRAFAKARPGELSGGECQRVAIARAVAPNPKMLLLDEPLGALDTSVRRRVRRKLRDLLDSLSVTVILVTHDYEDALVLAEHTVVLNQGLVVREGTHEELLLHPKSKFVADFTGVNFFAGTVCPGESELREIRIENAALRADTNANGTVGISFYPVDVMVHVDQPQNSPHNLFHGTVRELVNLGGRVRAFVDAGLPLMAEMTPGESEVLGLSVGQKVHLTIAPAAIRVSQ